MMFLSFLEKNCDKSETPASKSTEISDIMRTKIPSLNLDELDELTSISPRKSMLIKNSFIRPKPILTLSTSKSPQEKKRVLKNFKNKKKKIINFS